MARCKYFISILCGLVLSAVTHAQDHNVIVWQEGELLTWNDFRGKPEKRFAIASTNYDIIKNTSFENGRAVVSIEAVFFRDGSWKKKDWVSDDVLVHEQKHFDIVELFSRKLRKLIQEASYKDYNDLVEKVNAFYDEMDQAMDAYHDRYDEETDGSMNGDKQREWNKKISADLAEYSAYKNSVITVSLPAKSSQ